MASPPNQEFEKCYRVFATARLTEDFHVEVTWTHLDGFTSYSIIRQVEEHPSSTNIGTVRVKSSSWNGPSFVDSRVTIGKYHYIVEGRDLRMGSSCH